MNKIIYCTCHEPCYALCINNKCNGNAIMCIQGSKEKIHCGQVHKNCKKIEWKQFQKLINSNPRKNNKQFQQIQNKIDHLFIDLISKIKEEHINFKQWLTTYGLTMEAMNLVTEINSQNFDRITGKFIQPIVAELYKNNEPIQPPKIDDDQITKIKETIELEFINLAEVYLEKLKKYEFVQDQLTEALQSNQTSRSYERNASFMKNNMKKFSLIIQNLNEVSKFFDKPVKSMKLLYRASQHNFLITKFHQNCDNLPNTFIILKNQYDKIIGGYTQLKWSKDKKGFEQDQFHESFMFSLEPCQKYRLSLPQFAIAQGSESGPIFGCNDLLIADQANINISRSQFPICYKNQNVKRNTETSMNFCGSKIGKFIIKEWEVFQIQFQTKFQDQFMKIF